MTICIAAISERDKIIAVTDKMLTLERPNMTTTFEISDSNKVCDLTDKTLALFAGDVIHANEILKRTKDKIDAKKPTTVIEVANMTNEAFTEHWESVISKWLTLRYKVDLETFMKNQQAFDSDLIKRINTIVADFDIGVQILIAGIDNSPRIYQVDNGGMVVEQTPLGYACIGSGREHATLSLIESEYNSSFEKPKALYSLLEAKKRAEYDPGVGEHCDIAIIDGSFKKYDGSVIDKVMETFNKSRVTVQETKKKYFTEIKSIKGV